MYHIYKTNSFFMISAYHVMHFVMPYILFKMYDRLFAFGIFIIKIIIIIIIAISKFAF